MTKVGTLKPFQVVTVACPVCDSQGKQWKLKHTLYTEKNRDIDMRAKRIEWNEKVNPKVDPKLYYYWICEQCHFCSDFNFFQQPFKEGNMSPSRFKKLLKEALTEDPRYPAILSVLNPKSSGSKSDFITAMKKNLLAIYQMESISDIKNRESLQLASYYLRLSWLIRDIKSSKAKAEKFKAPTRKLLGQIREVWSQVPLTERDILDYSIKYYETGLQNSQAVSTTPKEIQIILLMSRLYFQKGDLETGHLQLISAKRKALKFAGLAQKKEKEGTLPQEQLDELSLSATKSQSLVKSVEVIFDKLKAKKLEKELTRAKQLLKGHEKKDLEVKRNILRKNGIEERTVLKSCPEIKKKGLLEFLKSG